MAAFHFNASLLKNAPSPSYGGNGLVPLYFANRAGLQGANDTPISAAGSCRPQTSCMPARFRQYALRKSRSVSPMPDIATVSPLPSPGQVPAARWAGTPRVWRGSPAGLVARRTMGRGCDFFTAAMTAGTVGDGDSLWKNFELPKARASRPPPAGRGRRDPGACGEAGVRPMAGSQGRFPVSVRLERRPAAGRAGEKERQSVLRVVSGPPATLAMEKTIAPARSGSRPFRRGSLPGDAPGDQKIKPRRKPNVLVLMPL